VVSTMKYIHSLNNVENVEVFLSVNSVHSNFIKVKGNRPVTGLDRLRGFQEVKAPRFRDNGTGWW